MTTISEQLKATREIAELKELLDTLTFYNKDIDTLKLAVQIYYGRSKKWQKA